MVELNGTLLISILNFIILVAVLAHFCYKPMLKVMDDRRNKIRNDLDSAARSSAEAAKLKSDLEAELANAQVAAQGIVDKAVREAVQAPHHAFERGEHAVHAPDRATARLRAVRPLRRLRLRANIRSGAAPRPVRAPAGTRHAGGGDLAPSRPAARKHDAAA